MKKISALVFLAVLLPGCGCEQVDTGYRGIYTTYGKIDGEPLPEGLHYYNPFTSNIKEISVREEKLEGETAAFTHDTQKVIISYSVTYYPDPVKIHTIYQKYGNEWETKIIQPNVLGAIKDAVGQYIADDLVSKREAAKNKIFDSLKVELSELSVYVTALNITNLDFDDAYEHAVEAKVVAVQKAAEAKNKTVEIQENAKQQVIAAEAEAKSMAIRSQALQQNKGLVEYEAVQKWDGKLPQYMMGNSVPFINLDRR